MADSPIAIAGAGIAGLALAGALQRAGLPVVVLEEREELAALGAGITLWPNALAALDRIGVGDEVRAAGVRVASGGMRRWDGRWLRRIDRDRIVQALGEPLVSIHRGALLRVLCASVDAGGIRLATPIADLREATGGVEVKTAAGEVIQARALIGADGTRSVVARWLDPGITSRYAGYTAWRGVAPVDTTELEPCNTLGRGREFGFLPIGSGSTYWFATEPAPEGQTAVDGELAHVAARFADWHDPIPALLAASREEDVLRHDVYDRTAPRCAGRGAVTVIGDAAHPMRPHLGQGGCQALEDAAALASALTSEAGRTDLPATLRAVERSRHRRTRAVVRESELMGRVIGADGALGALLQRGVGLVPTPLVLRHMAKAAGRT